MGVHNKSRGHLQSTVLRVADSITSEDNWHPDAGGKDSEPQKREKGDHIFISVIQATDSDGQW